MQLSEQIVKRRKACGLSQERFAAIAGVSLATLRSFEDGSRRPHPKTIKILVDAADRAELQAGGGDSSTVSALSALFEAHEKLSIAGALLGAEARRIANQEPVIRSPDPNHEPV